MRLLVTAFEPFGGEAENPTMEIIDRLHGVETILLPVSFTEAPRLAVAKIKEYQPDAVIALGQAKARLDKPENQAKLKRSSLEPEPVFGQLKYNHGYTRFRHFGKAKVTMDLGFVFMALNLPKLYRNTQKSL